MVDKADEQIRRAMEAGGFNDLPGKGKPLKLDDNPFEDPEWRLANHILQNGGFTLPWIEAGREIDADLKTARDGLSRAWARRSASLAAGRKYDQVASEWDRAIKAFGDQIAEVNKRIFRYNLEVPSAQFQRMQVNADREMEKISGSA